MKIKPLWPFNNICEEVEEPLKKEFKNAEKGVLCHLLCVAVKKEFGRRGIAKNLTKLVL